MKNFSIIDAVCNEGGDAYHFDANMARTGTARIGHFVKLSFPSANKELKPDVLVTNPENPDAKDSIVAVIESIQWMSGSNNEIFVAGRVSSQNKAILHEGLCSLGECADVEAEFVIYDFDHDERKYFKHFHTFKKPINLVISQVYIRQEPDTYKIKTPMNFQFDITLIPKKDAEEQKVGFSFRSNGTQFSRQLGGSLLEPIQV
jgi:hypothetical protein